MRTIDTNKQQIHKQRQQTQKHRQQTKKNRQQTQKLVLPEKDTVRYRERDEKAGRSMKKEPDWRTQYTSLLLYRYDSRLLPVHGTSNKLKNTWYQNTKHNIDISNLLMILVLREANALISPTVGKKQ